MQATRMLSAAVLLQSHHAQELAKQAGFWSEAGKWGMRGLRKIPGLGDDVARLGDDAGRMALNGADDLVLRAERAAMSPGPFGGNARPPRIPTPVSTATPPPLPTAAPRVSTPPPLPAAPPVATPPPLPNGWPRPPVMGFADDIHPGVPRAAAPAATNSANTLTEEAMKRITGKGGRLYGKPTVEQLNRGNRGFLSSVGRSFTPWRKRMYANDTSLAGKALNTVKFGLPLTAAYNIGTTPGRMERVGEYAAAQAMAAQQEGTPWEKFMRSLGLAFGSDEFIGDQLFKRRAGVGSAYRDMKATGYKPGESRYEDFKKLYLGL